jgi:hypothetical protein
MDQLTSLNSISWQNTNSKQAIKDFKSLSLNTVQFTSMQPNSAPKETYLTTNHDEINEIVIETNLEAIVIMGYAELDNLEMTMNF